MGFPKQMLEKGLQALKAAKSDKKEDAIEAANRKTPKGREINKKYHDEMPVGELKKDIKEDKASKQTPTMKADIKEDMRALKRKQA